MQLSLYVTLPWYIAKFLDDDNKPIKPLKSTSDSHYYKLHRSYSVSFNLANLGEIFFGTISILK